MMCRRRLPARIVTMAVTVMMAVWSTAVCLLASSSPHISHACCAKNPPADAQLAGSRTCCAENAPNYFASTAAPVPEVAPPAVIVLAAVVGDSRIPAHARVTFDDSEMVRPPGPRTYLALSNFRL